MFNKLKNSLVFVPRNIISTSQIPYFNQLKEICSRSLTKTKLANFTGCPALEKIGSLAFYCLYEITFIDLSKTIIKLKSFLPATSFKTLLIYSSAIYS